jgi:hypothetical protein
MVYIVLDGSIRTIVGYQWIYPPISSNMAWEGWNLFGWWFQTFFIFHDIFQDG